MLLSTVSPKLSRLSVLYLISTTISTSHAFNLFERSDPVCGGISGLSQCGDSFPSDFCCSSDTTCTRLNVTNAAAVICCPKGADCSFIQPTTCDISQLNATLHPDNQIHLANTTSVSLPKCGDKCCPLGYSCSGAMCIASTSSTSPTSSSTASTTAPTSSSPASDAPAASQTEAAPLPQAQCGFDGKAFAAGFIPGIILGALGTLALLWLIKKRREAAERNRYSGDFGHVARTISDPIYDPAYAAARTDFVRRGSHSAQPSPSSTTEMVVPKQRRRPQNPGAAGSGGSGSGMTPKIKSLWERTPKLGFGNSPKLGSSSTANFSRLPANGHANGRANGLPANPAPPAPAIRAGEARRDPYKTPTRTPMSAATATALLRTGSTTATAASSSARHPNNNNNNNPNNNTMGMGIQSSETIDVLMHPPSFLQPPRAPGMRENRFTQDSANTTFTKLMERAGFEGGEREEVRGMG
ncbi:hypothetical protein K491DRAFT_609179, partial [Lophiostoma macrostomum CBS 122681]